MTRIGKFISSAIVSGRRRIKVIVEGKDDVRKQFEAMPFGEDSIPLKDTRAIVVETGEKGKQVVVGYINVNQIESLGPGEKRIYSLQPNGDLSQYIHLKSDQTMEIGGNSDFMVRFNELKTAFDQLKDDHNELLNLIQTWTVVPMDGGLALQAAAATLNPSTADIDPAKINEIKTL